MVVLASAGGNTVPAIARLVQADEDTIRQVIHRFNEMGMASLDPRWAGGPPRQISPDDEAFIVTTAAQRRERATIRASVNAGGANPLPEPPDQHHERLWSRH